MYSVVLNLLYLLFKEPTFLLLEVIHVDLCRLYLHAIYLYVI